MREKKTKTMSKSELAMAYKINISTLRVWLKRVPGLDLTAGQRLLTPRQVALVMEHIGEP